VKRFIPYIKPYKAHFILGPLCMIVEVIGEVLMPFFLAQMINRGIADKSPAYVLFICALMVLTALLMLTGGVGGAYFGAKAAVGFATSIRNDLYKKVQSFSFFNIDKFSTGSLITRLTSDITQIQNFVNMLLRMCLRSPGMLIGALIMAVLLSPSLSVIFLVAMPLILITVLVVVKIGFSRFSRMQTKIDGLNKNVQENLTNVRVIKSFVRETHEKEKFNQKNRDLKEATLSAVSVMLTLMPLLMLFMNLTTIAVLWFGGKLVLSGTFLVGDLTAFITYITQILMSLMMVVMIFLNSSRALASFRRIDEVLFSPEPLTDEFAKHPEKQVNSGKIEFQNVDFRYTETSQEEHLSNINLTIESGETVGIIGSTGCGKTTLVSLIARLYDVSCGSVLVDGTDVRDYSLTQLRGAIGMVLQKNTLFSGTVKDNLRWGNDNATDEEIIKAAKSACADEFIEAMPDGYDSHIDQGGANLSGGQRQRLCIARALLTKPKILILDDSTSAVDTKTEAQIRAALSGALFHATKLIIAQRISSVKNADKIVVMDEGKIVGIGTHETLMEQNETYREILESLSEGGDA